MMTMRAALLPMLALTAAVGPVAAGAFDGAGKSIAAGAPVVRLLGCDLVKTSFKGDNAGFFSGAEKSVEATCMAGDTPIKFSATSDQWQTLLAMAGQPVTVKLAANKGLVKDAKTDWVLVGVTSNADGKPSMTKLCGDDKAAKEFDEIYSHGYRVGHAVDVWKGDARDKDDHWGGPQKRHKDAWYLDVRLSQSGNVQWAADGSVRLGRVCADRHEAVVQATTPLVFVYDQGDDDPEYAVTEIYAVQ